MDLVEGGRHVHYSHRGVGNQPANRRALARAFVAKAVWDMPTTTVPVDRLLYDPTLRRPVGWSRVSEVPSESTFSPRPPLVRGDPAAGADARGAGPLRVFRLGRRAHIAGLHGDRRAGRGRRRSRSRRSSGLSAGSDARKRGRGGRRRRPGWSGSRGAG